MEVCGLVPVAAIVQVFPAGPHRHHDRETLAAVLCTSKCFVQHVSAQK